MEAELALIGSSTGGTLGGAAPGNFRAVLRKLSSDPAYLKTTTTNPKQVLVDFPGLTLQELDALRDAAVLSGVDISNIEPLHDGIAKLTPGQPSVGGITIDHCCCCCCCGATGTVTRG